jgi:hypothetical protein
VETHPPAIGQLTRLFGNVGQVETSIGSVWWPDWSSLNVKALAIGIAAAAMLLGFRSGIIRTLAMCAGMGLALHMLAA